MWLERADIYNPPIQTHSFSSPSHPSAYSFLLDGAAKEYTLEKNMKKMLAEWEPLEFNLLPYRESKTYILSALDDAQQLLDDHIVKTQSMRSSPYIKPFENQIRDWEKKLLYVQESIDEWLSVQATWLYLEPIFSSEDIMNQMPEEARKFKMVDSSWRTIMNVKKLECRKSCRFLVFKHPTLSRLHSLIVTS